MRNILTASVACFVILSQTAALAVDLPNRKPGLWELTTHMETRNMTMTFCIDSATDAAMLEMGMGTMKELCSRHDMRRSGNVVTTDSVCQMGQSTMTSHSVLTFAGDSAYRMDSKSHFEPPMMKLSDSVTTQEAKWTGPCPAGMVPGDMVAPNGQKMHINTGEK